MSINSTRLNTVLSPQDLQDIESAIDLLEMKFAFLRTLTAQEKQHKVFLGVNNLAFVRTAKEAYDEMPELLPRILNVDHYENDIAMLMALRPLQARLDQLSYQMEDTSVLLGDHVFKDSLGIFSSAQEAQKRGIDGGRLWTEKLETRFEKQAIRREDEEQEEMGGQAGGSGGSADGSGNPTGGSADGSGNQGGSSGNQGGSSDTPTNGSGNQGNSSDSPDNDPANSDGQTQGNGSPSGGGGNVNTPDAG